MSEAECEGSSGKPARRATAAVLVPRVRTPGRGHHRHRAGRVAGRRGGG